jgi:hypothetical protein
VFTGIVSKVNLGNSVVVQSTTEKLELDTLVQSTTES